MGLISSAPEINTLAAKADTTAGLYFVTAFNGLLAPYWDPGAGGLLIGASFAASSQCLIVQSAVTLLCIVGLSPYTTPAHIARATLEANAFQTRAILDAMKLDSKVDLKHLKVDGGMTNGDLAMQVLADVGGFGVVRPEMREFVPTRRMLPLADRFFVLWWQIYCVGVGTLGWICNQVLWLGH
jgi:glycerol kinase